MTDTDETTPTTGDIGAVQTETVAGAKLLASLAAPLDIPLTKPQIQVIRDVEGRPYLVDNTDLLARPRRLTGSAKIQEASTLAAYILRHIGTGDGSEMAAAAVELWADPPSGTVTAVLDAGFAGMPEWGDHQAVFTAQTTEQWQAWLKHDQGLLSQADFAAFCEERSLDFVEPTAATMLEIATTFEAHTAAAFRSVIRLQNGDRRFQYDEETKATASSGGGAIEIPETFVLGLPIYEGGAAYRVTARLRYRLKAGVLLLGYALQQKTEVVRDAFSALVNQVTEATKVPVYYGHPRQRPARPDVLSRYDGE